ncbi:MARVEL domain-containing protein [Bacillus sp. BP-3]|nr:MARVEL domain-containing protein [Bacillus sp. BP-3]
MAEENRINKKQYIITFLVSTSYIWFLVISAYSMGVPQYNQLVWGIVLITAFTFIITVPIFYIGLPLLYIGVVLAWFRIFSVRLMLTYYVLSCFVLWIALFLPLKLYGYYEENQIFTKQAKEQRIVENIKQAVEKNNGPIKVVDVTKDSMLEWNEGTGSPDHPYLHIKFELLNCDKQKENIFRFSCTSSIEAYYKDNKWLVDFDSKENASAMNLSKDNQQAEENDKKQALTPDEETNIRKTAESKAAQLLKEDYNIDLTIVKYTFRKSTDSYQKENRPLNPIHAITINGYLNEDPQKAVTVRVEYDPNTKQYWRRIYEMSEAAQKEINKQTKLKEEKNT